jgi:hypothetical protein
LHFSMIAYSIEGRKMCSLKGKCHMPIFINKVEGSIIPVNGMETEREKEELEGSIGRHKVCMGTIYLLPISDEYNCVRCERCGMRITVEKTVNTREKLREYFAQKVRKNQEILSRVEDLADKRGLRFSD